MGLSHSQLFTVFRNLERKHPNREQRSYKDKYHAPYHIIVFYTVLPTTADRSNFLVVERDETIFHHMKSKTTYRFACTGLSYHRTNEYSAPPGSPEKRQSDSVVGVVVKRTFLAAKRGHVQLPKHWCPFQRTPQ